MLDNHELEIDELPAGYVISERYEVERFLGAGGMGSVHLARDRMLEGNTVAIKILHREYVRDEKRLKRFLREVKLTRLVNHPNVVRTYDVGADSEMIYFTMEYVSGTPLDEYVQTVLLDYGKLANLIIQICQGLEAIHNAKIVHRDLKPGNILVTDDKHLKITDFGVAKPTSSSFTDQKEIMGSVDYMAPEILRGDDISHVLDFYSLGIIVYELATGLPPFQADEPAAIMWMHMERKPRPPCTIQHDIPKWLNDLILKLLEKSPSERPQTARAIINYVKQHAQKELAAAEGDTEGEDQQDGEAVDASEKQAKKEISLRSACSAIIFGNFPTIDDIREHRRKVSQRDQQSAVPEPGEEETQPEEPVVDGSEVLEIEKLQKTIYWVIALTVIALILLAFSIIVHSLFKEPDPEKKPAPPATKQVITKNTERKKSSWFSWGNSDNDSPTTTSAPKFSWTSNDSNETGGGTGFFWSTDDSGSSETSTPVQKPQESNAEERFSELWSARKILDKIVDGFETQEDEKPEESPFSTEQTSAKRHDSNKSPSTTTSSPNTKLSPLLTKQSPFTSESPDRETSEGTTTAADQIITPTIDKEADNPPAQTSSTEQGRIRREAMSGLAPVITPFSPAQLPALTKIKVSSEQLQTCEAKKAVREKLFSIDVKLEAIDSVIENTSDVLRRQTKERVDTLGAAIKDLNEELVSQVEQNRYWSERLRSLATHDATVVAEEIAAQDKTVKERKEAYNSLSVDYRHAVETMQMGSPTKEHLAKVKELGQKLKEHRMLLKSTLTEFFENKKTAETGNLLNSTLLLDALQSKKQLFEAKLKALGEFSANPEAVTESEMDLLQQRDQLEAQLGQLTEAMSDEQERLLRAALVLGQITNKK